MIPTANLGYLAFLFNSPAFSKALLNLALSALFLKLAKALVRLALIALAVMFLASLLAALNPIVPGTPT